MNALATQHSRISQADYLYCTLPSGDIGMRLLDPSDTRWLFTIMYGRILKTFADQHLLTGPDPLLSNHFFSTSRSSRTAHTELLYKLAGIRKPRMTMCAGSSRDIYHY